MVNGGCWPVDSRVRGNDGWDSEFCTSLESQRKLSPAMFPVMLGFTESENLTASVEITDGPEAKTQNTYQAEITQTRSEWTCAHFRLHRVVKRAQKVTPTPRCRQIRTLVGLEGCGR